MFILGAHCESDTVLSPFHITLHEILKSSQHQKNRERWGTGEGLGTRTILIFQMQELKPQNFSGLSLVT